MRTGPAALSLLFLVLATPGSTQPPRSPLPRAPLAGCGPMLDRSLEMLGVEAGEMLPLRGGGPAGVGFNRLVRAEPTTFPRQACHLGGELLEAFIYRFHRMVDLAGPHLGVAVQEGGQVPREELAILEELRSRLAGGAGRAGLPKSSSSLVLGAAGAALAAHRLVLAARRGLTEPQLEQALAELVRSSGEAGSAPPSGLDRGLLLAGARRLLKEVDRIRAALLALDLDSLPVLDPPPPGYQGDLRLVLPTPRGDLVLGGPGRTVYRRRPLLVVDAGGDDLYLDGLGGADPAHPVAMIIDLGGGDLHLSARGAAQGGGCGGVAVVADLGRGADIYVGADQCQGAGIVGVGVLYDDGGANILKARRWAQGAGLHGLGLLFPGVGDDDLVCHSPGQGAAGPGGVGVLLDYGGQDRYHCAAGSGAGQGGGTGLPARAGSGGLALLMDLQGDDRYRISGPGQGAGLHDGTGILLDCGNGRDSFLAGDRAQGYGSHHGAGLLLVVGGNTWMRGGRWTQGYGADRGLGVLVDRQGDDLLHSSGPGQGAAERHGCGLLFDLAGDDERRGMGKELQGWSRRADGWGSLALFLDCRGRDRNSLGPVDGGWRFTGRYGLALDWPTTMSNPKKAEPGGGGKEAPFSPPRPDLAGLDRAWQDLVAAPEDRREAWIRAWAKLGSPAMVHLVERVLDRPGGAGPAEGEFDLLIRIATAMGEPAGQVLLDRYDRLRDDWRRLLCLRLLGRIPTPAVRSRLEAILATPARRGAAPLLLREAARSLGRVGGSSLPTGLARLAGSADPEDRMAAAGGYGGVTAEPALAALLDLALDRAWPVRELAQTALVARGDRALALLQERLADLAGPQRRYALDLIGRLGRPAGASILVAHLRDRDRALVWSAVRGLLAINHRPALVKGVEILAGTRRPVLKHALRLMREVLASQ